MTQLESSFEKAKILNSVSIDICVLVPKFKRGDWVKNKRGIILGQIEYINLTLFLSTDKEEEDQLYYQYTMVDESFKYDEDGLYLCNETEIAEHLAELKTYEAKK